MSNLNDLMLNLICDKRFTSVRLEHYDAFLEASLNNVAKRDVLSAVRKIIANGVGLRSYNVHLEQSSGLNNKTSGCNIEVRYDAKFGDKEHYRITVQSVEPYIVRVLDFVFANGVVELQDLSEKNIPKEKLSDHYACSVVDAFWNNSMKMCLNVKSDEGEEKVDEGETSEAEQRKASSIMVCQARSIFPF